ncbi:topless-related protein, putative [Medicago truncatula]|uniref:Topless-related protein, putative n=1 Tax=Medicago truncatula TaxID=3880 RepID=A0A072U7J5_MEDTR|nr:topless-related protein, putative [Medicago truncatula]
MGSGVDYDAFGHSSTTLSDSASCGTNKEGESFLVEWNESEGAMKHTYHGLREEIYKSHMRSPKIGMPKAVGASGS